ncbi:MAG: TIGR02206 family membrane protein [Pseudonocardiaceae bacterium]|nr:TIGR02206 family membrane protein [Pseudonocardiaceae bacterium]
MTLLLAERQFTAYGPSHWAAIIVLAVGAGLLVVLGRRQRDAGTGRTSSRALAVALLAFLVPLQLYWMLPGQWHIGSSLPLQLCDLGGLAAAYALWTHRAWAFALTYYWGLTLTSQAFLTPALDGFDFPHLHYIMFWGLHCLVVWAAIYLTWGLGLRPDWRGYGIAVGATVGWGLLMLGFNTLAGTNYGYVNHKPATGSVLDLMGPWPWYLLVELVVGTVAWALMTWPWVRRNRDAGTSPAVGRAAG